MGNEPESTPKNHPAVPRNYYHRDCPFDIIDPYRLARLYDIRDPEIFHAFKKLIVAGQRGAKDTERDVRDAIWSLERWLEIRREDEQPAYAPGVSTPKPWPRSDPYVPQPMDSSRGDVQAKRSMPVQPTEEAYDANIFETMTVAEAFEVIKGLKEQCEVRTSLLDVALTIISVLPEGVPLKHIKTFTYAGLIERYPTSEYGFLNPAELSTQR